MNRVAENRSQTDYDTDFQRWLEGQAAFLQQKVTERLDVENLVEELQGEVKAERALATTTFRLLLLTQLLKHIEVPNEWWHPYLESLMMHFPNSLPPREIFESTYTNTHPSRFHETYDAGNLEKDLMTLLEKQLSQNPSLTYYLNDRLDDIFVEAGEVVLRFARDLEVGNEVWNSVIDFNRSGRTSLEQLSQVHILDAFVDEATSYNIDHYAWLKRQITLLSVERLAQLDFENLAQEVSAIAKRDQRALKSRLAVLLVHLLKYQYQPERRGGSWLLTLQEQRTQIQQILEDSPSLKNFFATSFAETYPQARVQAHLETKLSINSFPETCPYTPEQALDPEFLPSEQT